MTWSGRLAADLPLRTTERDVWGNTRVSGLGRPPFPVGLLEAAAERSTPS